jgi:putative ABC transport system ATP-binding protein
MAMPAVIAIQDLRFAYDPRRLILDIASFELGRGERLFLYGPSGSGKTTLLGLLAGVLAATSGGISVLGQNLVKLSGHQRDRMRGEHIGYIFQQFNLIPYLSVIDNITLPCQFNAARRARLKVNPEAKAMELCQHLGIIDYIHRPVTELSVGQQQRVAACRALIGDPELIIADEPTSALDSEFREAFIQLLFKESKAAQSAILFVSHDQSLKHLFDRTVSLPSINRAGGH